MWEQSNHKKKKNTNCIRFSRFYAAPCRVRLVHAKNKRRTTEPTGSLGSSLQPSISFLPIQSMVRSQSSNLVVPSMNIARTSIWQTSTRSSTAEPSECCAQLSISLSLCLAVSLSLFHSPPFLPPSLASLTLSLSLPPSLSLSLSVSFS